MTTGNVSDRTIQHVHGAGPHPSLWQRLRIRPSSVYSAMVLIAVVGIAFLFRGFI